MYKNSNRLTDEAGAQVNLTRNGQGGVTAYADPRGLTTAYVRNGFGEIIQESGPDVGATVIVRDARGLATSITDPRAGGCKARKAQAGVKGRRVGRAACRAAGWPSRGRTAYGQGHKPSALP